MLDCVAMDNDLLTCVGLFRREFILHSETVQEVYGVRKPIPRKRVSYLGWAKDRRQGWNARDQSILTRQVYLVGIQPSGNASSVLSSSVGTAL